MEEKDIESLKEKIKQYENDAKKYDKLKNYNIAYNFYMKAAKEMELLLAQESNPDSIKKYQVYIQDYKSRADAIKEIQEISKLKGETNELESMQLKIKSYATQAVKCDKNKEYKIAYFFYMKSVKMFEKLLKLDENPKNIALYKEKISLYSNRAKDIGKNQIIIKFTDNEMNKMLDVLEENQNVKWEDIAGYQKEKEEIKEALIFPFKFPQLFKGKRKPYKSVLLFGSAGNGKSSLIKAVQSEIFKNFFYINCDNLLYNWHIERDINIDILIKGLFELARNNKPSVICFDEIDDFRILDKDENKNYKTTFWNEINKIINDDENIIVLGIMQYPWKLSDSFRNLFKKFIHIPLPDSTTIKEIIKIKLKKIECVYETLTEDQFNQISEIVHKRSDLNYGSGIDNMIGEVFLDSFRKYYYTGFFKKIQSINGKECKYVLCDKDESGAIKMKLNDIPKDSILVKVGYEDFLYNFKKFRCCLGINYYLEDLKKNEEFKKDVMDKKIYIKKDFDYFNPSNGEFGMEG